MRDRGQWGTGDIEYSRVKAMGHMCNGAQGQWGTEGMGYKGYRVQGYGVQGVWATLDLFIFKEHTLVTCHMYPLTPTLTPTSCDKLRWFK